MDECKSSSILDFCQLTVVILPQQISSYYNSVSVLIKQMIHLLPKRCINSPIILQGQGSGFHFGTFGAYTVTISRPKGERNDSTVSRTLTLSLSHLSLGNGRKLTVLSHTSWIFIKEMCDVFLINCLN